MSFLAMFTFAAFAQEEASEEAKKQLLPEAGDIALGTDAIPYINFLGNCFNDTQNNELNLDSTTVHLRYYLTDNSALRFNIALKNSTNTLNYYVQDDAAVADDPLSQAVVEDRKKNKSRGVNIQFGYMKMRNIGRMMGYVGAQLEYGFSRDITEFEYGNSITVVNQSPTTQWGSDSERNTYTDSGIKHSVAAGGFIGAEYYFLPKICIGGEFCINYRRTWNTQSNYKEEYWNGEEVEESNTQEAPGNSSWSFSIEKPTTYGGLYLMFCF